jgi:hypothetical protein
VPDTSATHVHFYWNVFEANQVGTNAASFGAIQGNWELTDKQPFVPTGELLIENRPTEATGVCVTPTNGSHEVINPGNYHCVPLPPTCVTPLLCIDSLKFELFPADRLAAP